MKQSESPNLKPAGNIKTETKKPRTEAKTTDTPVKNKKVNNKKHLFFILIFVLVGAAVVSAYLFIDLTKADELSYKAMAENQLTVFGSDLVCVKDEGTYGYMNKSGELIIDFQFDYGSKFLNGLATVEVNGEWFVINRSGKNVLNDRFSSVKVNSNGLIIYSDNFKFGVLDKQGNVVVQALYDYIGDYSDGLAVVELNGKYGYINESGQLIVNRDYDLAHKFTNNIGLVKKNDRYAFINTKGENVTEFIFDDAYPFMNNLAIVGRENLEGVIKYGIINNQGKTIVDREYDSIAEQHFSENEIFIAYKDELYYLLDIDGEVLNPLGYTSITTDNVTKFMIAENSKEEIFIIDNQNNIIFTDIEEYDSYNLVVDLNQKYFALNKNDRWMLYDETGTLVISYECDSMMVYNNLILIYKDLQYGAIDFNRTIVIDFLYDNISSFVDGYAAVKVGDDYGVINDKSEIIIPIEYQDINFDPNIRYDIS